MSGTTPNRSRTARSPTGIAAHRPLTAPQLPTPTHPSPLPTHTHTFPLTGSSFTAFIRNINETRTHPSQSNYNENATY